MATVCIGVEGCSPFPLLSWVSPDFALVLHVLSWASLISYVLMAQCLTESWCPKKKTFPTSLRTCFSVWIKGKKTGFLSENKARFNLSLWPWEKDSREVKADEQIIQTKEEQHSHQGLLKHRANPLFLIKQVNAGEPSNRQWRDHLGPD